MSKLDTTFEGGVVRVLGALYGEILCKVSRITQMSVIHLLTHSFIRSFT